MSSAQPFASLTAQLSLDRQTETTLRQLDAPNCDISAGKLQQCLRALRHAKSQSRSSLLPALDSAISLLITRLASKSGSPLFTFNHFVTPLFANSRCCTSARAGTLR